MARAYPTSKAIAFCLSVTPARRLSDDDSSSAAEQLFTLSPRPIPDIISTAFCGGARRRYYYYTKATQCERNGIRQKTKKKPDRYNIHNICITYITTTPVRVKGFTTGNYIYIYDIAAHRQNANDTVCSFVHDTPYIGCLHRNAKMPLERYCRGNRCRGYST